MTTVASSNPVGGSGFPFTNLYAQAAESFVCSVLDPFMASREAPAVVAGPPVRGPSFSGINVDASGDVRASPHEARRPPPRSRPPRPATLGVPGPAAIVQQSAVTTATATATAIASPTGNEENRE